MSLKIVDVSSAQGNYKVGANGEDGVIIKATQGTNYKNPNCDYVAQQVIKSGAPWGLYHYASGGDANQEAAWFLSSIDSYLKGDNEPLLILDWEAGENTAWGTGSWVKTWVDAVKGKTQGKVGLYTGDEGVTQTDSYVSGHTWLWYANYPSTGDVGWSPPTINFKVGGWGSPTGWQFSDTPVDKSLFDMGAKEWGTVSKSTSSSSFPKRIKTPLISLKVPRMSYKIKNFTQKSD